MTKHLAICLLLLAPPALAQNHAALFEEAAAAIDWNLEDNWAYTETRLSEDKVWVAKFDPRRIEDEYWSLISVDGRSPTGDEIKTFEHDKSDHETEDSSQRMDVVGIESLELIEETDDAWLFTFVPDEDEVEFVDNVDATARIVKDGPYIEFIDIRNHSNIEPGWGTRIGTFNFRLQFGPAIINGPIVPKAMEIRISGRALLFIGFDEHEIIEYSDFEFAGNGRNQ